MILKEFCSSKINGLVMKNFFREIVTLWNTLVHIDTVSVRDITLECLQITPTKFRGSKFPGNMHNYMWCPYYLRSFMKLCSVVSEELWGRDIITSWVVFIRPFQLTWNCLTQKIKAIL
jgi:hypothetical protein